MSMRYRYLFSTKIIGITMALTHIQKKVHHVQNGTLIGVLRGKGSQGPSSDLSRGQGQRHRARHPLQHRPAKGETTRDGQKGFETGGRDLDNEKLLENFQRKIRRQMWVGWFGTKGEGRGIQSSLRDGDGQAQEAAEEPLHPCLGAHSCLRVTGRGWVLPYGRQFDWQCLLSHSEAQRLWE